LSSDARSDPGHDLDFSRLAGADEERMLVKPAAWGAVVGSKLSTEPASLSVGVTVLDLQIFRIERFLASC